MLSKLENEVYDPLIPFTYGLKSPESRRQYPQRFKVFLDFLKFNGNLAKQARKFWQVAKNNPRWAEENLMKFITVQNKRADSGEISPSTIPNYYKATKLFCEMNEITLNWKKIAKGLPRVRDAANDRAPTVQEIQRLVQYPDRRIRPIVFLMASSGIRIGAFDYLQWKHIKSICNDNDEIVAAKITVYAGDSEQYYSFMTAEAYNSLKEWMEFRSSYGEQIGEDSWIMRDIWQTTNITYGANLGLATYPKKLKSSGIRRLIERALWEQGLRRPLEDGKKRHEWKAAHGFRKFYKTRTEQIMKPINVEITMGHDIGVSASYYKPTEREVLQDYLKAVDSLTIETSKSVLEKRVRELSEKSKENVYILEGRLKEKEDDMEILKKHDKLHDEAIAKLVDLVTALQRGKEK